VDSQFHLFGSARQLLGLLSIGFEVDLVFW